jgi:aminoglycoside/choline kinase family phosphotransferase
VSSLSRETLVANDVRLEKLQAWLATVDAPPDKEDLGPYVQVAQMLVDVGVNAPRVLERNDAEGFLLNTDLGSRTYLAELEANYATADRLYDDAITALVRIQAGGQQHAAQLPPYDEALLRREMALFPDWFCAHHLGLDPARALGMSAVYDTLVVEALRQPRVFVHRDYHSRNLMVSEAAQLGPNPGILDFQDAVYGPLTYDLVSLLRDCYIAWPLARVERWVAEFFERAKVEGVAVPTSESALLRAFDFMGVQRHLKAIGIFARLWHRDGKPGYLKDIPRTLGYVKQVSAKYAELEPLSTWIDAEIEPTMTRAATTTRV